MAVLANVKAATLYKSPDDGLAARCQIVWYREAMACVKKAVKVMSLESTSVSSEDYKFENHKNLGLWS